MKETQKMVLSPSLGLCWESFPEMEKPEPTFDCIQSKPQEDLDGLQQ